MYLYTNQIKQKEFGKLSERNCLMAQEYNVIHIMGLHVLAAL